MTIANSYAKYISGEELRLLVHSKADFIEGIGRPETSSASL
jgi:hypothetical protein